MSNLKCFRLWYSPLTGVSRAQRAAINTLGKALGQVEREAGMIGVVVLAGPDPEHGGSIRVIR